MRLLTKANAIFNNVCNSLATCAALLIVFLMLFVSAEVVMRYFLKRPMGWSMEITEYALLYITFLGAAWVLKREGHVTMDLIVTRLKPRTQLLLSIITSILGAIICFAITWYGVTVAWEHFEIGYFLTRSLRIASAFIVVVIPVGSSLLFIQFLIRAHGYIRHLTAM